MSEIFKFPNGYDVTVLRKEDVIKTIHSNIIDADIALAIIEKLEIDSSTFLKEGRWVGIPFMGSLRIPPQKKLTMSDEHQALVKEAREKLDSRRYILFRKELAAKDAISIKKERYFNYVVSLTASRNKELYRWLLKHYEPRPLLKSCIYYLKFVEAVISTENEEELIDR